MHINNLYKDQTILMFKECYALEKIHGTSAHIAWTKLYPSDPTPEIRFFSGGEKHERFVELFNKELLTQRLTEMFPDKAVTIYGEAYGGKQQGMSETYGKDLKFIVFDVLVSSPSGDTWLSVPDAHSVAEKLGLEFVHYKLVPTTLEALDKERDADSEQAIRNGVGPGKKREGVVLRPIVEVRLNNGSRIIAKHKRAEFRETKTERKVVDPAQQKVLEDANAVAVEWVTPERLRHVLDKIPGHCMEKMPDILRAMVEDVNREGAGEFVPSKEVNKAISKYTAVLYKEHLQDKLVQNG